MNSQRKSSSRTEARNARSIGLDLRSTQQVLRAINREDARVAAEVGRAIPAIARAVDKIVARMRAGGRLIYIGAGTSGRLATLDAAELPPTFGSSPRAVCAVIAGGRRALTSAVEGSEDSRSAGSRDLKNLNVTARDAVAGLSASGATPYVLRALEYAKRRGALTIGITAASRSPIVRASDVAIAMNTGPEVITGSTRMKAGTAQKLVLNMLSTAAMVQMGRVYDNWMIGVAPANRKLRRRGLSILSAAAGVDSSTAARALRQAGLDLRTALVMLKRKVTRAQARKLLAAADGNLRRALGEDRRPR